jgi:histidinol-phosphate aminotransferase
MSIVDRLARKEVAQLAPYTCARDLYKQADAFLDANENSFGGSVGPVEGIDLSRYPDSDQTELRREIAQYAGVKPGNVLVGNGSDEIIDLCIRSFVETGDNVVSLEPGYSMYGVCAAAAGGRVKEVLLDSQFQLDLPSIAAATDPRTKIVFLVSPNSPAGVPVKKESIVRLLKQSGTIVFVDEAYVEFGGESCTDLVEEYENLIVSRTFSKAWGLAGLRVGYAISNEKTISLLRRLKAPYNVNALSGALALRALRSGVARMEENVAKIRAEREWLREKLDGLGFEVYASVCNFLLTRPPLGAASASEMQKRIASEGLIVRDRSSMKAIPNTFRITIGTPEQNRKLLDCIRKSLEAGAGYDCVLFDMDGVLVDVRNSYRKAIEETANWYFAKNGIAARAGQQEISEIKSISGFNNDWDATFALVRAAKEGLDPKSAVPLTKEERQGELYSKLKERFQEIYLGGLIRNEPALVANETLAKLRKAGMKIGIVTGRPREEAMLALQNNGWQEYFPQGSVVALEDCDEEKPSPAPLLLAAKRLGASRLIYVGDSTSDAAACKSAKIPCVIVGSAARGDWNVRSTDEILSVVK